MLLLISQRNATAQSCSSLPTPDVTFVDGQIITSTVTYTSQVILLPTNSTVTFAADVTMSGCTLIMRENAVINIQDSRFTLQNNGATRSLITGCENMWSSIKLNSRASITFTSSDIRHGRTALLFNSGSDPNQCSIVDCKFEGNQICISASNLNSFSPLISGNLFDGYSNNIDILLPMSGTFSTLLQVSAFDLNQVNGNLSGDIPNEVTHMTIGLNQFEGNVFVNNFNFINNNYDEPSEQILGGFGCLSNNGVLWIANATFQNNMNGVYAKNNAFILGGNLEVLDNTLSGFQVSSSSVLLQRSHFVNNNEGITAKKSNLSIGASPQYGSLSNHFSNNQFGIKSSISQYISIENNVFENQTERDIVIAKSISSDYFAKLTYNTCNLNGLSLGSFKVNRPALPVGDNTSISFNLFNLPSLQDGASFNNERDMRIIEVNAIEGATDQALIERNTINCHYGNGPDPYPSRAKTIDGIIALNAVDGYQINYNDLDFTHNSAPNDTITAVGIGMIGVTGVNNNVLINEIYTTWFSHQPNQKESWLRCGIHVDNSPHANLCSNRVDDPRHVYHFLNDCSDIELAYNYMLDGMFGLENWGNIPPSRHHRRNVWAGDYSDWGARSTNQTNLDWHVDNASYLPPSQEPGDWFKEDPTGDTTPRCETNTVVVSEDDPKLLETINNFLDGNFVFPTPVTQWDFERNLLEDMIRFPATYAGDIRAENYYAGKVNTPIWQLANVRNQFRLAAALDSAQEQTRTMNLAIMQQNMDSLIGLFGNANIDSTTNYIDTSFFDLAWRIQLLNTQSDQLETEISTQRTAAWGVIKNYLDQIPADTAWAANDRLLFSLCLKDYLDISWTSTDSAQLIALAQSCPAEFGFAVTLAREMLPDEIAYAWHRESDDPDCAASRSGHAHTPQVSPNYLSVFPNPALDQISLLFGEKFEGKIDIVSAATGATLRTHILTAENATTLYVGDLSTGGYILHAVDKDGEVLMQKFNISR